MTNSLIRKAARAAQFPEILMGMMAIGPAFAQSPVVPSDKAQAAVKAVTQVYKPRPALDPADAAKPPLVDGDWSVRTPHAEETTALCESAGTSCYAVLYRAGKPQITCVWTVAFGSKPGISPQVVAQNAEVSQNMLRVFNAGDAGIPGPAEPPKVEYPNLARRAHIDGEVELQLIADTSGKVVNVQIISGPTALRAGLIEEVLAWHMKPCLLNGQPIPYAQIFSIHFNPSTPPSLNVGSALPHGAPTS